MMFFYLINKKNYFYMTNILNYLQNYIVVGIGNIVGWGDKFIQKIKKYKL